MKLSISGLASRRPPSTVHGPGGHGPTTLHNGHDEAMTRCELS
jgi:hypothetical protein